MMEKKIVRLIMVLLFALVPSATTFSDTEANPKTLILSFSGAGEGLSPTELIKGSFTGTAPFVHSLHIYSPKGSFNLEELQGIELYSNDNIIFEIVVHYPTNVQQLTSQQEIAQESHSIEVSELIENTAEEVAKLIKNFHNTYPNAYIEAVATAMGGEVLLRTLGRNVSEINNVVFYYPTMAMVNEAKLVNILKENGYSKDRAKVIAYVGDPTIPQLERLKSQNVEIFKLFVIEAAD